MKSTHDLTTNSHNPCPSDSQWLPTEKQSLEYLVSRLEQAATSLFIDDDWEVDIGLFEASSELCKQETVGTERRRGKDGKCHTQYGGRFTQVSSMKDLQDTLEVIDIPSQ